MLWTREKKNGITTYMETKSFKIFSKEMQPINMIMNQY